MFNIPFIAQPRNKKKPFYPKLSVDPDHVVILLGAGMSTYAHCPMMHGFIDLAKDFLKSGRFDDFEKEDIEASLLLYDNLRTDLVITEEDIENIENIMSIADMIKIIDMKDFFSYITEKTPNILRNFIDSVITKSINVIGPNSEKWVIRGDTFILLFRSLILASIYYRKKISIITLNYDCLIEYACHCLGVRFTYNQELSDGIEILKLHGSTNWLQCLNPDCNKYKEILISPMIHSSINDDFKSFGHLERLFKTCDNCQEKLVPVFIPPTWGKEFDEPIFRKIWERAFKNLAKSEILVSIGYSLPETDTQMRELLHLAFSTRKLRQAVVFLKEDEKATNRWNNIFRKSWRDVRFEVRNEGFDEGHELLIKALNIDKKYLHDHYFLLPLEKSPHLNPSEKNKIISYGQKKGLEEEKIIGLDWNNLVGNLRRGKTSDSDPVMTYYKILSELGYDWLPEKEIKPSHNNFSKNRN